MSWCWLAVWNVQFRSGQVHALCPRFVSSSFILRHLSRVFSLLVFFGHILLQLWPTACARFESGLLTLVRADHHFRNKVDNSAGRLLGIVLGKQVTHVVRGRASFPGHKAEDPAKEGGEKHLMASPSLNRPPH